MLMYADANEAVFRINYPPLKGYGEYVGTKTTFDFSNHHNAQELIQPNSLKFIPTHTKTLRSNMVRLSALSYGAKTVVIHFFLSWDGEVVWRGGVGRW